MLARKPLLLAGLLVLLRPGALVGDYQDGLDAYQRGAFEQAFAEWIVLASAAPGSVQPAVRAEAQYAIGMLYWVGQGVAQDTTAAANWLREAAELNHAGAQLKLGFLFLTGDGVAKNEFEAFKWFRMAASQGEVDAQYNLGVMYRDGLGVEADQQQAVQWFYQAAALGDPVSAGLVADYERHGVLLPTADAPMESGDVRVAPPSGSRPLAAASPPPDRAPPVAEDAPLAPAPARDEAWIRQRDPQRYTIQVIALLDREKLHAFIDNHPQLQPFAIFRSSWNGRPLWVLLQGDYADAEQAQLAVRSFPTDLHPRDKLWVRRFLKVQGALAAQP